MCSPGMMDPNTMQGLGAAMTAAGSYAQMVGQKQGIAGMQGAVNAERQRQAQFDARLGANNAPLFNAQILPTAPTDVARGSMDAATNGILAGYKAAGGSGDVANRVDAATTRGGANAATIAGVNNAMSDYNMLGARTQAGANIIRSAAYRSMQPLQAEINAGATNGMNTRFMGTMGNVIGPAMIRSSFYAPQASQPYAYRGYGGGEALPANPYSGWGMPAAGSQSLGIYQNQANNPNADVRDMLGRSYP